MKFKLQLFYCFVLLFSVTLLHSQGTGSGIKGVVIDEKTGQPLPGATVAIKSLKKTRVTDAEGNFIFSNIVPGVYELSVSAMTFNSKQVTDIIVVKDDIIALTISLEEKSNQLDEIVITTTRAKQESVKSLLTMQKNSATVSDGVSAETIKRTPDKNTSDVLKRISGASIQDNKFVVVRGLNDRYNAAILNGGTLPSSESDRKAFSFDIFPSNMLDNLVITKTASPDMPGEFAGGVIQVNTKAVPDKNFQSFSIGSGYNTITTFKEQTTYKGGGTDILGYDDGTRDMPSTVPGTEEFNSLTYQEKAQIAKTFEYDWGLQNNKFAPNLSLQYTLGHHFDLGSSKVLGMLFSATYSKTNNFNITKTKDWDNSVPDAPSTLVSTFSDDKYNEQILTGVMGNFSLRFNQNHNISCKNIFSINSTDLVAVRTGQKDVNDTRVIDSNVRWFTSNIIYSGQLNGDHYFSNPKIRLNWTGFFSEISRSIPNMRRNVYSTADPDSDNPIEYTPVAGIANNNGGADYGGGMFWSENKENIVGGKFDFSKKFDIGEELANDLKLGGFVQYRDRDFFSRQLQYNTLTLGGNFDYSLLILPDPEIFVKENMGVISPGVNGFTLFDFTKYTDSYRATSNLNAAYLMLDNRYKKFRFVWGVRLEDYKQTLDSRVSQTEYLALNRKQMDVLPSVNVIYSIDKKQNLRVGYSQTVNRPEFRELAPFGFYDFVTQYFTQGNPDLKIAEIQNVDLRYELYPGKGQLFSVSYFWKKFENPIELQQEINNKTVTYRNAKSAKNGGLEFEFRTLLSSIFDSGSNGSVLDDLTLYSNISFIKSEVDLSNISSGNPEKSRPLQGQSPYVLNAGLQYLNRDNGWGVSANFNRVGNRVAIASSEIKPAIWEKARSFLDMQVSKSFNNNKMELKLNIQNILAQDLIFYSNNYKERPEPIFTTLESLVNYAFVGSYENKEGYDSHEDDEIWVTKYGRTFSLSFSYNF